MNRTILVAFNFDDSLGFATDEEYQRLLGEHMADVHQRMNYVMPDGVEVSWWIAEDDRIDGSDNDSAVFVTPGRQHVASVVLHGLGLTPECNIVKSDSTANKRWDV